MRLWLLLVPGLLLLAGCVPEQFLNPGGHDSVLLVPSNPFSAPGPVTTTAAKVNYTPGDPQKLQHVNQIGQQLLTANPDIGMKPRFALCGTPNLEMFHQGNHLIFITEGLVKKCQTDGQLGALLAHEMATMVVEREALANPRMRNADKIPPPDVMIGNGVGAGDHELSQARLAELAKFEKRSKQEQLKPLPLPDVDKLATQYLGRAGFDKDELERVRPLLKEAEHTYILEKQLKQSGSMTNWTPNQTSGTPGANAGVPPATPGTSSPPTLSGPINLQLPPTLGEEGNKNATPVPVWQGTQ